RGGSAGADAGGGRAEEHRRALPRPAARPALPPRGGDGAERPARPRARPPLSRLDGAAAPRGGPRGDGSGRARAGPELGAPSARHARPARYAGGPARGQAKAQTGLLGGGCIVTRSPSLPLIA